MLPPLESSSMVSASTFPKLLSHIALGCSLLAICFGQNTVITPGNPVLDSQVILSDGEVFALGFFSPGNSTNRYAGIWYNNIPGPLTVVWVANRESPVPDTSGSLAIAQDGNLVVMDGKNSTLWSTDISGTSPSLEMDVVFLQSGNLILRRIDETVLWESFMHYTDTVLPGMKLWINATSHRTWRARSWKNANDPAPGAYSLGLDYQPGSLPQAVMWNGSNRMFRSGILERELVPKPMNLSYVSYITTVEKDQQIYVGLSSLSVTLNAIRGRVVITPDGQLETVLWRESSQGWTRLQDGTIGHCDLYSTCGPFGSCMLLKSAADISRSIGSDFPGAAGLSIHCEFVKGYEPKNVEEWSKRNWSSGCVRINNRMLGCGKGREVQFLKMERLILPDLPIPLDKSSLRECEDQCRSDCSCLAYAFPNVSGLIDSVCFIWKKELLDIRVDKLRGQDLYVRVDIPGSPLGNVPHKIRRNLLLIALPPVIFLCLASIFIVHYRWRGVCRAAMVRTSGAANNLKTSNSKHEIATEVPLFKFTTILAATNNFDVANKLGEGGFGPVYKGILMGQDVAVKRLSKFSRQGHLELKNEVELIVKLQHKNLVRLLGWCAHGEEKILVYEYLPNKSLDRFLFDPTRRALLSWEKRFSIIEGIAQGLLYLHRHSRLKIIHRDLKASNILLDGDMNPKISDFGMARIFGGNQTEANTNRVVGTYGYMAPEYAFGGNFSEKSDVYSFGVLVIEIVTGKKITDTEYLHCTSKPSIYPLGYAWHLWREGKGVELMDAACIVSFDAQQVTKCVKVGLLCVQEDANDRPTMASVISMLGNDGLDLPEPNMPAFSHGTGSLKAHNLGIRGTSSSSSHQETVSIISPR